MKLVVPSIGSIIHVGSFVSSGRFLPVDSSPINLKINVFFFGGIASIILQGKLKVCQTRYEPVIRKLLFQLSDDHVLDLTIVLGHEIPIAQFFVDGFSVGDGAS